MEKIPGFDPREITILAYLKSLFAPDQRVLPAQEQYRDYPHAHDRVENFPDADTEAPKRAHQSTLITLLALMLAICAQLLIEYSNNQSGLIGLLLYTTAVVLLVFAYRHGEWAIERNLPGTDEIAENNDKKWLLIPAVIFAVFSFVLFRSGAFEFFPTSLWLLSIALAVLALRETSAELHTAKLNIKSWFNALWSDKAILIGSLAVLVFALFFRLYQFQKIPPELISAQIDHLGTVKDILEGNRALLFNRNLVNEPVQYYWTAAFFAVSGKALTYTGLRFIHVLTGLISVFYINKLGHLLFNREVGLIAAVLFSAAFWPNLQVRAMLGSGLVLSILVPAIYYLYKGIITRKYNNLLASSILFGLGLMTHKVFLIFPLAAFVIFLGGTGGNPTIDNRKLRFTEIAAAVLLVLVVTVPLLRAITLEPAAYFSSILSRIGSFEAQLAGNPVLTFINNFGSALGIANWSNRSSWVDGIGSRPALDWFTAALFVLGAGMTVIHAIRKKDWLFLPIVLLYPVFLFPTAAAVAFPSENPSLSRAIGAVIPATLLAAMAFQTFSEKICMRIGVRKPAVKYALIFLTLLPMAVTNYDLAFGRYPETYKENAWNASDMAKILSEFKRNYGDTNSQWVVGYPYWVDARAVAIESNQPHLDMALMPDQLAATVSMPEPKIFLLNPQDLQALEALKTLYPNGLISTFQAENPAKNFVIFAVDG